MKSICLLNESKKAGTDLARELGIKRNQLYKWKEEIEVRGNAAFPGKGRRGPADRQCVPAGYRYRQVAGHYYFS